MINLVSNPQLLTWAGMLTRGLVLFLLLFYAGSVLEPVESTVFLLFISIVAFQSILDFGFAPAFIRFIAYLGHNNADSDPLAAVGFDYTKTNINEVITVFEWIYFRLTIVFFLLMATIGSASLINPISKLAESNIGWLSWIITLSGSLFLFSFTRYAAILTGSNQISMLRILELKIYLPLLVFLFIGNYLEISYVWMILILNLGYFLLFLLVRRQVTFFLGLEKKSIDGSLNQELVSVVFQSAWRSGLGVLLSMGTITGSGLIVAQLASPVDASTYLSTQRLIIALGGYCYVPFQVIIPQISTFFASGNKLELLKIADQARAQVLILVLLIGLSTLIALEFVLPYFGYSFRLPSTNLWLVMIMYLLIERAGATNMQLHSVSNKIKWHIANGVSGVIMICCMPFFYEGYGILGMPISFLFGYLIFYLPYSNYLVFREFGHVNLRLDIFLTLLPITIMGLFVFNV